MEAHISHSYVSYVIDPQVYGLDASIWKTVSGTPTVTSNKYRLNAAEIISYSQFKFGEFEFNVTVPAAPTAADNRSFGVLGKSVSNRYRVTFTFTTAGELRAQVYGKYGTSLFNELIPWNAAWTNVATLFRIAWMKNAVVFTVSSTDGTNLYSTTFNGALYSLNGSLGVSILNGNADNMDVTSVAIVHSAPSLPLNGGSSISALIPGTGATNLGKAEDSPHTTGDVGVEILSKRTDTPASSAGTDGDYATINTDSLGHTWTRDGYSPTAEVNADSIISVQHRPVAGTGSYSWTPTSNFGGAVTASVKSSAGQVFSMYAYQTNASARFEQLHNTATTPSGGAVPVYSFLVPASGDMVKDGMFFGLNGAFFSTGIAFAHSTTFGTYTAGTAADGNRTIHWK